MTLTAALAAVPLPLYEDVSRLAAYVTALSVLGAALVGLGRLVIVGPIERRLDRFEARLAGIESEFRRNGGSTLKDAVSRLETSSRITLTALQRSGHDVPDPADLGL